MHLLHSSAVLRVMVTHFIFSDFAHFKHCCSKTENDPNCPDLHGT